MRNVLALSAVVLIAGCGGSGASAPATVVVYEMTASTAVPLAAPIPVGGSVTINVQEQGCRQTLRPNGPPVGGPEGCGPFYAPAALAATVETMANTHQPCPVTVRQTAPGTLVATRTAPGDPVAQIGNTSGACFVDIRDPQTNATSQVAI
jgi:hypothetical protein